jgi:hypothetical protein
VQLSVPFLRFCLLIKCRETSFNAPLAIKMKNKAVSQHTTLTGIVQKAIFLYLLNTSQGGRILYCKGKKSRPRLHVSSTGTCIVRANRLTVRPNRRQGKAWKEYKYIK